MHQRRVRLHPDPAAALGQEAIIFGGYLSFVQHCKGRRRKRERGGGGGKVCVSLVRKGFTVIVGLTDLMGAAHGHYVRGMDVLIERLLDEVLRLVAG